LAPASSPVSASTPPMSSSTRSYEQRRLRELIAVRRDHWERMTTFLRPT
jgi:hypothetical protein